MWKSWVATTCAYPLPGVASSELMPRATAAPPATASEPPSQKSFCTSTMISARISPTVSSGPGRHDGPGRLLEPQRPLPAVHPGGRLAVIGLAADKSIADLLAAAPAVPADRFYRAIRHRGRIRRADHGPADDLARGPHRGRPAAPRRPLSPPPAVALLAPVAQTGRLTSRPGVSRRQRGCRR